MYCFKYLIDVTFDTKKNMFLVMIEKYGIIIKMQKNIETITIFSFKMCFTI